MKNLEVKKIIERYKYFIIAILVGTCFMLISTEKEPETVIISSEKQAFDIKLIEEQLEDILSSSDGVGKVKVMLTVSETSQSIYAKNINEGENSTQSEVVLVSNGSNDEPIKIKNLYPKFEGALVVCDGAEKSSVKLMITDAIRSLCDIPSNKITVTKMKE